MFGIFRRSKDKPVEDQTAQKINSGSPATASVAEGTDLHLIAVITAAIARFRENEGPTVGASGFIVRRVRRI